MRTAIIGAIIGVVLVSSQFSLGPTPVSAHHFTCCAVAVNPLTNRVYYRNQAIDGATNLRIAILPQVGVFGLGVNRNTNRIYLTDHGEYLYVLDGTTHQQLAAISLNIYPPWLPTETVGVAVDSARNRIYALTYLQGYVVAVDGVTNQIVASYAIFGEPWKVAVNEMANCVYVTQHYEWDVWAWTQGSSPCFAPHGRASAGPGQQELPSMKTLTGCTPPSGTRTTKLLTPTC